MNQDVFSGVFYEPFGVKFIAGMAGGGPERAGLDTGGVRVELQDLRFANLRMRAVDGGLSGFYTKS